MKVSVSDIIQEWYIMNAKEFRSPTGKGTTRTIPIETMLEDLKKLFEDIKSSGYSEEHFTIINRNHVFKCCIPAYVKGRERGKWQFNVGFQIDKARIAVFGPITRIAKESVTEKVVSRYHETYKDMLRSDEHSQDLSKNEDTITKSEQEEEFEESKSFKPLDRDKLKESLPDVSEDDSWIHDMAESYDE